MVLQRVILRGLGMVLFSVPFRFVATTRHHSFNPPILSILLIFTFSLPFTLSPVPSSFGSRLRLSIGLTSDLRNLQRYQSISRYHSFLSLRTSFPSCSQPPWIGRLGTQLPIPSLHSFTRQTSVVQLEFEPSDARAFIFVI